MSQPAVLGLIDCNNFFASCEQLFRPDLEGKPVVVLSSNDGCVVARSNEAKALGIPMGAPAFKYRQLFKDRGVIQFSANFELYSDISDRITRLLTTVTPRIEVYSVDESFMDLSQLGISDLTAWATALRQRVFTEVGVPVSIGIASSKTLAKLATGRAKQATALSGVLNLIDVPATEREQHLQQTPIADIWGVGWRLAPKLRAEGIHTAFQLARLRPEHARQLMGIHGRQMVAELNGLNCHPLERFHKVRRSVMHGRLFGEDTADLSVIEAAIASLTARATMRLRRENLLATNATLRLATNRHKPGYQSVHYNVEMIPTADTGLIAAGLVQGIPASFNRRIAYHRADVLLSGLTTASQLQTDLLGTVDVTAIDASLRRLAAVDAINKRFGTGRIHYAAEDLSRRWQPKRRLCSPRYTNSWDELPIARILS